LILGKGLCFEAGKVTLGMTEGNGSLPLPFLWGLVAA